MNPTCSYANVIETIEVLPLTLRERRKAAGLSIRAVAADMGVAYGTVHRLESGQECHADSVLAALRWLDRTT